MNCRPRKNLLVAVLALVWLVAVGLGMWRLAAYSFIPGAEGAAPQHWPANTGLVRNLHGFTAVIALHPECPCSQATLEELDSLIGQSGGRLEARLLFVELPGLPAPETLALWRRASRIGGASLVKDEGGAEARRFGVRTSGETRLYGADGSLLFYGGITEARGHAGDNPGQAAIAAAVSGRSLAGIVKSTPVFGCALWNESAAAPQ